MDGGLYDGHANNNSRGRQMKNPGVMASTWKPSSPLAHQMSSNNCGLHTFIRLLTLHNHDLKMEISTNFIETHSTPIRAWMIHILLRYDFGKVTWQESLRAFIKRMIPRNGLTTNHPRKRTYSTY